jgi:excisionase family DNA binding protein
MRIKNSSRLGMNDSYMQITKDKTTEPCDRTKLMTPDQVADILSVAKITVYRIMAKRKIRFSKIGGRVRFRREDIERYIEENSVETMGN